MYSKYSINTVPKWAEIERENCSTHKNSYDKFCECFIKAILSDKSCENKLYSPINIYLILSMLSEITDNKSREQLLHIIGSADMKPEQIRKNAEELYIASCGKTDEYESNISNSLWLFKKLSYEQSSVDNLSKHYAEVFKEEENAGCFVQALKYWLNEKTGGMLSDNVENLEFNNDTTAVLASALYLSCAWYEQFDKEETYKETFYGSEKNSDVLFMHMSRGTDIFYSRDFTCVPKGLTNGGNMWFVLPNEGENTSEICGNGELAKLITNPNGWENTEYGKVSMSLPIFDIKCDNELTTVLEKLGVHDVFDCVAADFSPLCKDERLYINKAEQAIRLKTDENGIEAASYTVMGIMRTCLIPEKEIEFKLNRPFIFAITNEYNEIMLVGEVNNL